jgi:hypothetical protein
VSWVRGVSPPYSAGSRTGARSPSFSFNLFRLPNRQNRLKRQRIIIITLIHYTVSSYILYEYKLYRQYS